MKDLTLLLSLSLPVKLSEKQAQRIADEISSLRAENDMLRKENAEITRQYDILEHDYNLLKDEFDALECGLKSE